LNLDDAPLQEDQPPLLIGATGTAPLDDTCSRAGGTARHIEEQAALAVDDVVVPTADWRQAPLLVRATIAVPLDHTGSIARGCAIDIKEQIAVMVDQLIGTVAYARATCRGDIGNDERRDRLSRERTAERFARDPDR